MIYENMKRTNVYPASQMVKLGDTVADIQEGLKAAGAHYVCDGIWNVIDY